MLGEMRRALDAAGAGATAARAAALAAQAEALLRLLPQGAAPQPGDGARVIEIAPDEHGTEERV